MHMPLRSSLARIALALAGVLALTGFTWFGRSLVNGYYVSAPSSGAVIMAHLVEAPPGHLSGALVVTSLAAHSSSLKVTRITVRGSIAGGNITLRTPGFFGHFRTVYVGTLKGDTLTLSRAGHSSFTLNLSSEAHYHHRLAVLAANQTKVNAYREDQHRLLVFVAYGKRLLSAIPPYLAWGRARIKRQASYKAYWQRKAQYYDSCLATIRPLAAAGERWLRKFGHGYKWISARA